jgi:hypothetical protein
MMVDIQGREIVILGKKNPLRGDRQGSINIPCCSSASSITNMSMSNIDPRLFPAVKLPFATHPTNVSTSGR